MDMKIQIIFLFLVGCVAARRSYRCNQPKLVGFCRAALRKFYYDQRTKSCKPFPYGGCGLNGNNFNTKEECNKACGVIDTCNQPKVIGPCKATLKRFYYDQRTESCKRFVYGGCRGNANNFNTKKECSKVCGPCTVARTHALEILELIPDYHVPQCKADGTYKKLQCAFLSGCWCVTKDGKEIQGTRVARGGHLDCENRCNQPKEIGRCRGALKRFYYDQRTKSCKPFRYGGCEGNANNFNTKEECSKACGQEDCLIVCPLIYDPVCGTDGETYENICTLRAIKICENKNDLHISHKGDCTTEPEPEAEPIIDNAEEPDVETEPLIDNAEEHEEGPEPVIDNAEEPEEEPEPLIHNAEEHEEGPKPVIDNAEEPHVELEPLIDNAEEHEEGPEPVIDNAEVPHVEPEPKIDNAEEPEVETEPKNDNGEVPEVEAEPTIVQKEII